MRAPCRRRWRPRGRPPAPATSCSSLRPAPPSTCSTTTSIAAKCSRTSSGSSPDDRDSSPHKKPATAFHGAVGGSGGGAALAPPQLGLNAATHARSLALRHCPRAGLDRRGDGLFSLGHHGRRPLPRSGALLEEAGRLGRPGDDRALLGAPLRLPEARARGGAASRAVLRAA